MRQELSHKKILLVGCAATLFIACVVLSIFNVQFESTRNQLEDEIDQLSEEKENLRARYLSEISLNELDRKALAMEMKHASALGHYKVSIKESEIKRQRLMQGAIKPKTELLVSGY